MIVYDARNRLAWLLLVLLAALNLVLGILILKGDGGAWGPIDHPTYPTMQRSGWTWEGHGALLAWVWLLGVLQILLSLCLLGVGLARPEGLGRLRIPLLAGALLHVGLYSWMILAHVLPVAPSVLGFPPPTVVMVFFLWLLPPFHFVVLYVAAFDLWILPQESQESFLREVASRRGRDRG